jgi:hypothetical protein
VRITAGHGSAELTGLLEKIKAKKASVAAAEATKAAASADRAAKKTESDAITDATAAAELAKWRACQPASTCQPEALARAPFTLPHGVLAPLSILRKPEEAKVRREGLQRGSCCGKATE